VPMEAAGVGLWDGTACSAAVTKSRISPRIVWLILALTTIVAAALRFPFLDHQSLWLDEIFTREILGESSLPGVWHHVAKTESTPPLYYVIGWFAGAHSAVSMRVIPALALTATVPVSYVAFRRLVGERAALATAAILAVSPMLVSYSTDARSYGLLVFTGLLTVWGFSAVLEHPSSGRYGRWALACVACVWTHYFGGFLVIAEVAILLVLRPPERLATLGWLLIIAVCTGPLVPLVAGQASGERAAFIETEPLVSRVLMTVRQVAIGANVPRNWLEGSGLAVWWLAVASGAIIAIRGDRGARMVLILAAGSVGLPLLMGLAGIEDRFYSRNVIVAMPTVAALAATVMLRLRAAPLVCYLTLALVTAVWVATDWRYEQTDWRDAISRVEAVDSRAPIIAVAPYSAQVVSTYLGRKAVSPAGLVTKSVWIMVAPIRGPHDRTLVSVPALAVRGFRTVRELKPYDFRLILAVANRPTHIVSGVVSYSTVFPGGL